MGEFRGPQSLKRYSRAILYQRQQAVLNPGWKGGGVGRLLSLKDKPTHAPQEENPYAEPKKIPWLSQGSPA
jgi:hypothetical protein